MPFGSSCLRATEPACRFHSLPLPAGSPLPLPHDLLGQVQQTQAPGLMTRNPRSAARVMKRSSVSSPLSFECLGLIPFFFVILICVENKKRGPKGRV